MVLKITFVLLYFIVHVFFNAAVSSEINLKNWNNLLFSHPMQVLHNNENIVGLVDEGSIEQRIDHFDGGNTETFNQVSSEDKLSRVHITKVFHYRDFTPITFITMRVSVVQFLF